MGPGHFFSSSIVTPSVDENKNKIYLYGLFER